MGDDPQIETEEVSIADHPYIYPSPEKLASSPVTSYYFGIFSVVQKENYESAKTKVALSVIQMEGHGTFDYDSLDDKTMFHYCAQFIKFGFGRASRANDQFTTVNYHVTD